MTIANDLRWAISSSNLTNEPWLYDWPLDNGLLDWLCQQLQDDETRFTQTLQQPIARRLGHYFEQLWHYYWLHCPSTQIINHGLQVIDGKQTIGEADFLLDYCGKVFHVELACKFYLQWQNSWLGPNAKDSWAKKSAQMQHKQLKLFEQDVAKQLLANQGLPQPEQAIAIAKGRMFDTIQWITEAQRTSLANECYCILTRQQWLAPVDSAPHRLADIQALQVERPVCIAVVKENHEKHRFFIVPNHWPNLQPEHR
ncbi:DUF1853 family protein [Salinibius halmophilus]|uniref:DUF1853 family protein n=1 Tax=Salinibius halmophilus TaxID=1853216 RepID=UPI000E66FF7F|nr:DUF1853 family protein [Salinibius halmophilus]